MHGHRKCSEHGFDGLKYELKCDHRNLDRLDFIE